MSFGSGNEITTAFISVTTNKATDKRISPITREKNEYSLHFSFELGIFALEPEKQKSRIRFGIKFPTRQQLMN